MRGCADFRNCLVHGPSSLSVPGPLVIISAVAGGSPMGLLGAFIAIPVTASILLIIRQLWVPRQNAKLWRRPGEFRPITDDGGTRVPPSSLALAAAGLGAKPAS